ncbi:glucose-6-phosphate isomerase [Fusibacter tunisiensis]|uniref:Glucose-6-phosphate isomerase n=1 Tax=Fusibacter tunisiensis TaxID=1008308 RepID=A0ABS2MQS8_9FIRM|nr:glucose-6-phosphate isomerase [Fusibacter tunisiensis]MBM7561761.1 glucose-6-phosphate isomerase [Fusibacter tunisiensis]
MGHIKFDYTNAMIQPHEYTNLKKQVELAHQMLHEGNGPGNDYIGWLDYPENFNREEYERIKASAKRIASNSDVLIVIGIGGSYLGAKTVIDALSHTFYNELPKEKRKGPKIYFAGHQISGTYLTELLEMIQDQDVSLNVISKSGTTTEPAIAFRVLKKALEDKYGKEGVKSRIYATTDSENGALRKLANAEGYESFVIPANVGGRYSVLTPVGLLPIAAAGIDVDALMAGAAEGMKEYGNPNVDENPAYQYALVRNVLYRKGKAIEALVNYEPSMAFLSEWWMQLFGESEGKDGKGLFPTKLNNTTDLHSMGQMVQDGPRHLFETVVRVEAFEKDIVIESDALNLDGLNYLSGKTMSYVNDNAFKGTLEAHLDGNVPNCVISMSQKDAFTLGKLLYFFMKACGISGYVLGVNPFDQPGVEAYKKNMFRLLGK